MSKWKRTKKGTFGAEGRTSSENGGIERASVLSDEGTAVRIIGVDGLFQKLEEKTVDGEQTHRRKVIRLQHFVVVGTVANREELRLELTEMDEENHFGAGN